METLKTFRHEYKYALSYEEMLRLREKLDKLLEIDRSYSGYMVRSLYFDSLDDSDYYDKLDGIMKRKKIRLRIYDSNDQKVKLEMKEKYDIHQLKSSLIINRDDAKRIIEGDYSILLKYDEDIAKKLYTIMVENTYKPKDIIEYQRIAYVTNTGGRITFDFDIRSSDNINEFFNEDVNYVKIPSNNVILEIKFDRYLEPYISEVLGKYIGNRESISKYMLGRNVING